MVFEELQQGLIIESKRSDIAFAELDNVLESTVSDYSIFLKKAARKVLTEGGTDSDMEYYAEEAKEGFIAKAISVVEELIESLKEFFKRIRQQVTNLFAKKDLEKNIMKISDRLNKSPKLKGRKVKTINADQMDNCASSHTRAFSKLLARVKSGGRIEDNEIENENANFKKKFAIASAATMTISIGALMTIILAKVKKVNEFITKTQDEVMARIKDAKKSVEKMTDPEMATMMTRVCAATAKAAKFESETHINIVTQLWLDLKKGIAKGDLGDDDDVFDESAELTPECGDNCECADTECGDDPLLDDGSDENDDFVDAFNDASGIDEDDALEDLSDEIDDDDDFECGNSECTETSDDTLSRINELVEGIE